MRKLFVKLAPTLVRVAAESAARWISRRVRGPSGVRRAEQAKAIAAQLGVTPPVPRVA